MGANVSPLLYFSMVPKHAGFIIWHSIKMLGSHYHHQWSQWSICWNWTALRSQLLCLFEDKNKAFSLIVWWNHKYGFSTANSLAVHALKTYPGQSRLTPRVIHGDLLKRALGLNRMRTENRKKQESFHDGQLWHEVTLILSFKWVKHQL